MKRIALTLLIILYIGCSHANSNSIITNDTTSTENEIQYDKLIDLAKIYLHNNTAYAFNCAYKAQILAEESDDKIKIAECNIIMGNIFNAYSTTSNAINYYEKAIEYLIALKKYDDTYKMYIKIANLYQSINSNNKSINAMNNAMEYAQKTNDPKAVIEVNLAFGDLYASQGNINQSTQYYDKVLKNNIDKNTIDIISNAFTQKAKNLKKTYNYKESLSLIDSSLYLCIREFNDSLQIINYSLKGEIYDSIKDFESAKKYYMQAAKLAYDTKFFDNCGKNMLSIGFLNKKSKNYKTAIEIFKMICDSTEKFKMLEICQQSYYQISQCYALIGEYENAYLAFNKYDSYYDSTNMAYHEKNMNKLRNNELLSLNIKDLKIKELEQESKKRKESRWFLFALTTSVLSLISITFIILHLRNKTLIHKNKETTYEQQLKIDKMENDLMEYQLKSSKESVVNLALHLKSYIELINPLKDELKEILNIPKEQQHEKIKSIYNNLQKNILILNNKSTLNKDINLIYKDFLDRLNEKYPDLTKSEKKLCSMLYMNMSSKDIAVITNTTIRSVETSRYRLRKKFNLSREDDIVGFLQNL